MTCKTSRDNQSWVIIISFHFLGCSLSGVIQQQWQIHILKLFYYSTICPIQEGKVNPLEHTESFKWIRAES